VICNRRISPYEDTLRLGAEGTWASLIYQPKPLAKRDNHAQAARDFALDIRWDITIREIARRTGSALSTVRKTIKRSAAGNLSEPLPEGLTGAELEGRLYKNAGKKQGHRAYSGTRLGCLAPRTQAQACDAVDPVR